jgi:hypothetical protein
MQFFLLPMQFWDSALTKYKEVQTSKYYNQIRRNVLVHYSTQ